MDQLKDVILSTLAEIQEEIPQEIQEQSNMVAQPKEETRKQVKKEEVKPTTMTSKEDELLFLESLRERFLVLFEGFQAPNNAALEAKVDLTLNFMEYVLATLETRIETIKGK